MINAIENEKSPILYYTEEPDASYFSNYNNNSQQQIGPNTVEHANLYYNETESNIFNNTAQHPHQVSCPSYENINWREDDHSNTNSQLPYHSEATSNVELAIKESIYSNYSYYTKSHFSNKNQVTSPRTITSPSNNQQA